MNSSTQSIHTPELYNHYLNPESAVAYGEYRLLQGSFFDALEAFEKAESSLGGIDPEFYYRTALALFEFGSEEGQEKALLLANKKFKKAFNLYSQNADRNLDETRADLLHAWGNTLALLGERQEEHHFFLQAKDKFEKAFGYGKDSIDLYWDYGNVWVHIGIHSEEAIDIQRALIAFERASEQGEKLDHEFWLDYGIAALIQAPKVNDVRFLVKAVHCFKWSISLNAKSFDAWSYLSEALQKLHENTYDEAHYEQASEAFSTAYHLNPQNVDHLLEWAKFLLQNARKTGDLKRLRACLEKCHLAHSSENKNALVLSVWAEALALLGELSERLDLIYEAENKIEEALELDEEDPEIWCRLGMCFSSFGRYFNDYDYYYQAIEKFQTGISINRAYDPLWQSIANTYVAAGILENDFQTVHQSLKFYEKSLSFSVNIVKLVDYAGALSKLGEMTHSEEWLEKAIQYFEMAFCMQKNAAFLHPEWLFSYATTLDMLGDFHDDEKYYTRAIEIYSHILMVDPDFPHLHHRIAQTFCHLGELVGEIDHFSRAIHHLRLALKQDEDNDTMILDWGIALISIAQHISETGGIEELMSDAKQKLVLAAKLGNVQAYYQLSCYFSILRNYDESMYFLSKAEEFNALPPLDELLNDDWLDNLRATMEFREFLSSRKQLNQDL